MRRRQLLPLLALTLAFGAVPARVSQAQWQVNGVPLCTDTSDQNTPNIAPDGAGGAFVTWSDYRNGSWDIYVRRVNAAGVPQWPADGVALCSAENEQVLTDFGSAYHAIVSDGAGGAIVTWLDRRSGYNYDIYAQRVNAAGATQWTDDGVALCTSTADQRFPAIASDGAGGAIVTWYDAGYVYAQRVDAAGALQWTAGGVALCLAGGGKVVPQIVSDGAGGAIVTWYDVRNGNEDIYAQRVNAAGALQWGLGGVALCTDANAQYNPNIASDGAGGAIVTWLDERNETRSDIYAQRVDAAGAPLWTDDGVPLCTAGAGSTTTIVSDGTGGAIVAWEDGRNGVMNYDIYAQRVSAAGAMQWTVDGVALCTAAGIQTYSTIIADGAGGAIATWYDNRDSQADIYAQRVSAAGAPQWTSNGVALCTAGAGSLPTIVSDGAGGAIVTWVDTRSGNYDIYAQRVYGSGGVVAVPHPSAPAGFQILALSPNPTRDGQMTIRFNLPSSERASAEVFDLEGKRVRRLATDREFPAGTQALGWDGRNDAGVGLPSGVYFVKVRVGTHSEARRAVLLH